MSPLPVLQVEVTAAVMNDNVESSISYVFIKSLFYLKLHSVLSKRFLSNFANDFNLTTSTCHDDTCDQTRMTSNDWMGAVRNFNIT